MVATGRYEFVAGTSAKFWELEALGNGDFEAHWGRIGNAPQGPKVYDAIKAEKVVKEKVKKGYELVQTL
jgi:predicted DNA-binding WGR domain protein